MEMNSPLNSLTNRLNPIDVDLCGTNLIVDILWHESTVAPLPHLPWLILTPTPLLGFLLLAILCEQAVLSFEWPFLMGGSVQEKQPDFLIIQYSTRN